MKKQFKKAIATILTLTMAMTVTVPAFATDEYVTDTSVNIVTAEAFQNLFNSNGNARSISSDMTVEQVAYNYTFEQQENNPELADVTLSFVMTISGETYPVMATGTVDAHSLSSGEILWEGPIEGNVVINNKEYHVLAGFAKLNSSSDIQVSITLQSNVNGNMIEPVVFTFGDTVITKEVHDDIMTDVEVITIDGLSQEYENIASPTSINAMVEEDSVNARFSGSVGGTNTAQTAHLFLNTVTNELAVSIQTYESNLDEYFSGTGYPTTLTDSFEIEFTIPTGQEESHAWIDATQNYSLGEEDKNYTSLLISSVFSDALSVLGCPSSTINTILGSLRGNISHVFASSCVSLSVTMGTTQVAVFENLADGLPLLLQLDVAPDTYSGNTDVIYSTALRYRTQLMDYSGTSYQWVYTDANDINESITITI